jgi:hypothetical protein
MIKIYTSLSYETAYSHMLYHVLPERHYIHCQSQLATNMHGCLLKDTVDNAQGLLPVRHHIHCNHSSPSTSMGAEVDLR